MMPTMLERMKIVEVCWGPKPSWRSAHSANTVTHDVNAIAKANWVRIRRPSTGERSELRTSANVGAIFTAPCDSGSSVTVRTIVSSASAAATAKGTW